MTAKRTLKLMHVGSTAWFVLCAAYLVTLAMRQAGVAWWFIFSMSGYSAVIAFVLISIYLFAIYRGATRSRTEQEYPLTSSFFYRVFYDVSPFLGIAAGLVGGMGLGGGIERANMIAFGSLATTFLVWVILDPAIVLAEMYLPESRRLRKQRIAREKAEKRRLQVESDRLLAKVYEKEIENYKGWQPVLEPLAKQLAHIISTVNSEAYDNQERRTVEIGAQAWQLGGVSCMRRLHEMAIGDFVKHHGEQVIDYVAVWWDGIGTWRKPLFAERLGV